MPINARIAFPIDTSVGGRAAGTPAGDATPCSLPERVNTAARAAIQRCLPAVVLAMLLAGSAAATVAINAPWVRVADDARSAHAYMEIEASEAATLVAAASPIARRVAIRRPIGQGKTAADVPLPPGSAVLLAPGRASLELIALVRPLRRGERIALTLTFRASDGTEREIPIAAEVRRRSPIDDHRAGHAH